MPVSFLTDNERERLQRFPSEISPSDITAFFTLSETDLVLVRTHVQGVMLNHTIFASEEEIFSQLEYMMDKSVL